VGEGRLLGDVLASLANDNALHTHVSRGLRKIQIVTYQLSLVVYCAVLGNLGNRNIIVEASDTSRGLDED
jgi:hypothetical protein